MTDPVQPPAPSAVKTPEAAFVEGPIAATAVVVPPRPVLLPSSTVAPIMGVEPVEQPPVLPASTPIVKAKPAPIAKRSKGDYAWKRARVARHKD